MCVNKWYRKLYMVLNYITKTCFPYLPQFELGIKKEDNTQSGDFLNRGLKFFDKYEGQQS